MHIYPFNMESEGPSTHITHFDFLLPFIYYLYICACKSDTQTLVLNTIKDDKLYRRLLSQSYIRVEKTVIKTNIFATWKL